MLTRQLVVNIMLIIIILIIVKIRAIFLQGNLVNTMSIAISKGPV